MTNPSPEAGPSQQFRSLRLQIPVIEFADSATDELIEPYPSKGLQWHKTSRMALLLFAVLAVITITLTLVAFGRLKNAEQQFRTGRYNDPKAMQAAAQRSSALNTPSIQKYLKEPQFLELLAPAFLNCSQWSLKRGALVTISYTSLENKDSLDTLTSLDKGMAAANYQRMDQKDDANNQHLVTYGPK